MTSSGLKRTVIAILIGGALAAAYSLGNEHALSSANAATQESPVVTPAPAAGPVPTVALPDMSAIVARNGAAVVNISISGTAKGSALMPGFPTARSR